MAPTVCLFDVSRTDSNAKRSDADQEEERRVFYGNDESGIVLHSLSSVERPTLLGEVFLPDALIGKDEDFARRWLQEQEQTSTRKRQEIRDTEIAARAARDELSRLISGEKVHGGRASRRTRRFETISVESLQNSREQPAGNHRKNIQG